MGREHPFERSDWLLPSRRKRLTIIDLMVMVALAAFCLSAVAIPGLTGGERLLLGVVALAFLGLQGLQWGLASIPESRSRPGRNTVLGILSYLMAMSMFIGLVVLGLILPQGAALIGVAMLILVVYMTTWD